MPNRLDQRATKVPPHVSIKSLRTVSGMTQQQVCDRLAEIMGLEEGQTIPCGTLSAIESGTRGASRPMLDALAIAYGLEPGDIVTNYAPRKREAAA